MPRCKKLNLPAPWWSSTANGRREALEVGQFQVAGLNGESHRTTVPKTALVLRQVKWKSLLILLSFYGGMPFHFNGSELQKQTKKKPPKTCPASSLGSWVSQRCLHSRLSNPFISRNKFINVAILWYSPPFFANDTIGNTKIKKGGGGNFLFQKWHLKYMESIDILKLGGIQLLVGTLWMPSLLSGYILEMWGPSQLPSRCMLLWQEKYPYLHLLQTLFHRHT